MRTRTLLMAGCLAAAAWGQDARFGLGLTVHGAGGKTVYRGQPVLVEATLVLEEGDAATVSLKDGAAWAQAVSLQLWSSQGEAVAVEWTRLQEAQGPMKFTGEAAEATAVFALNEAATSALASGGYLLTAKLDTRQSAAEGSWAGTVSNRGAAFAVADEPAELPAEGRVLKSRVRARWLQLSGNAGQALEELDQALVQAPESVDLLADRADALAELERKDEAIAALESAIQLFRKQHPKSSHPPRLLLERLARLSAY